MAPVILINFKRAEAPDTTDTPERGHPKCLATSAMSSALALPSTGEARSRATQVPEGSSSSALTEERGLARTEITKEPSGAAIENLLQHHRVVVRLVMSRIHERDVSLSC